MRTPQAQRSASDKTLASVADAPPLSLRSGHCLAAITLAAAGCDETPDAPRRDRPATLRRQSGAAPRWSPAHPAARRRPRRRPLRSGRSSGAGHAASCRWRDRPGGSTEKAMRGVGAKGSKYGGGIITEPVRQYFCLREAAVFEIQIPSGHQSVPRRAQSVSQGFGRIQTRNP